MKPQFGSHLHPYPRETHHEAGTVRRTTSALQTFRPVLPPPLSPQELRRYDPRGAKLQPLVLDNTERSGSIRSLASRLFRHQSRTCPQLCHLKRCAPSREESLLQLAKI